MKKYKLELSVFLVIAMGLAVILPGFIKGNKTITLPGLTDFTILTLLFFAIITMMFFAYKPSGK